MNAPRNILFVSAMVLSAATLANPIRGAGAKSCAEYLTGANDPAPTPLALARHMQLYQWVLGYLSATNHYRHGALLKKNPNDSGVFGRDEDLDSWLDAFCAANPKRDLYEASQFFVLEQEKRRP